MTLTSTRILGTLGPGYRRQTEGVRNTRTDSSSTRPSSMARAQTVDSAKAAPYTLPA
ncbi:MAG: hypothetical protein ACOVN7_06070 [Rubrivivax sp.]